MSSNNIIQFPKQNDFDNLDVSSLSQEEREDSALQLHIINVSIDLAKDVFSKLDEHDRDGHSIVDGDIECDLTFVYEAIKSAVSKLYGVEGELQDLAGEYDEFEP